MNTQGSLSLLFRGGLRKDFKDNYDQYEDEWSEIVRVGTIDTPEIAATIFTGPSRMFEIGDGEPTPTEDMKIGPKVMAVDREFGLAIGVSRKTIEDDQYGKARAGTKWIAHAARMTKEVRIGGFLDDAPNGTLYLGIDGLALCHTAHTLLNSSLTYSNKAANPVQLSVAGLSALHDLFINMKDHNGDPAKIVPDTLIIGNNSLDIQRANQIFSSTKEPFTANNEDSGIRKVLNNPKIVISRFKTSAKSYFLISQRWWDAWLLQRRPVEFDTWDDKWTRALIMAGTQRFLVWFVDPRGVCGSFPS